MNAPDPVHALRRAGPDEAADPLGAQAWRQIVEATAVGYVTLDAEGRTTYANAAAAELLGLTRAQVLGHDELPLGWQALDADDRPLSRADHPALRCLRSGAPVRDAVMGVARADGTRRWLRLNCTPLVDEAGRLGVATSIIDTSARRGLAEQARLAHARLQALFTLSPIGIQLYDIRAGRVVDCNQAMEAISGYSRQQMLSEDCYRIAPEHAATEARWSDEVARDGRFGPTPVVYIDRDGRRIEVEVAGMRFTDPDGSPYLWSMVQDISGRRRLERALLQAASQDRLTGLPNKASLVQRLQDLALRAQREPDFGFSVLFLGLDRFKQLNDTLGHDAGDELLIVIAQRLLTLLLVDQAVDPEAGWMAARFGGDEFVVLAPGLVDPQAARAFAERLLAVLSEPHAIQGHAIHSGAGLGIAIGQGADADAQGLLRDADIAMAQAKRHGRRHIAFFDDAMRTELHRRAVVEAALRDALARHELSLLYQPIVDLDSGRMGSVEALLRWQHPTLGAVSPNEFIPIAEESGLIVPLGAWALRESCLQWRRWQQQDAARAPATVSVNLSRVQMQLGRQLIALVHDALDAAAMPGHALQLEITEREVMKDPQGARELMQGLRAMGVKLAMDDFGTGTSSLGCLRDYPFQTIKIDKSFVTDLCRDPHVLAVAHATVNVIENLGMVSVAEGIEDPAEVAALQAMGCRFGQGYYFARPQSGEALLGTLSA